MIGLRAILGNAWTRFPAYVFRPRYENERLIARIGRFPDAPLLQEALVLWKAGHGKSAESLLVEYFTSRGTPRFFVDARAVLRQAPPPDVRLAHWIQGAAVEMREATQLGLPVYSDRAAPLRPGFSWQGKDRVGRDDLLFLVRPHRFAFAPRLALAICAGAALAGDFHLLLDDWMRFARAQPSLPFCSNLVVTQRLFAAAWAFAYLAAVPASEECVACRFDLLKIVGQDLEYLIPRLGDSYPNNHLLLDRFADWFIALFYPEFRARPFDLRELEATWLQELHNQTYQDGSGFEHSVYYHGLATEMASAYLLLARANGQPIDTNVEARITKMLRMQAELCGPDGNVPDIGDGANDPIFSLDSGAGSSAAAFREIYRSLYAPEMRAVSHDHPSVERAFWLLGGKIEPPREPYEKTRFSEYSQGGIVVFPEDADSTRCVFRTGPAPGVKCHPGHMHADLLSVTLTCRGAPVLIDAGTCSYRFRPNHETEPRVNLRRYFAGPHAHNGFVAGDRDPLGPMTGDFRSAGSIPVIRHVARGAGDTLAFAEARMERADGYPPLARGVIHIRGVGFVVYNITQVPSAATDLALAFQFAPECEVEHVSESQFAVRRGCLELAFPCSEGLTSGRIVRGREYPTNGWASSRYGTRAAAPQLLLNISGLRPLTAVAVLNQANRQAISIECAQPAENTRCFRIRSDEFCDYILLNIGPEAPLLAWGVVFHGRLAWLRVPKQGQLGVRWLDGLSCVAPGLGLRYQYDKVVPELCH